MGNPRSGFGPAINDIEAYDRGGSGGAAWSITGSEGSYALHHDDTAGNHKTVMIATLMITTALTATYRWLCLALFNWTGTLTTNNVFEFLAFVTSSGTRYLRAQATSTTAYEVALYSSGGSELVAYAGSFTAGTDYSIRIETNGSTLKVWMDGSLLLTYATSETLTGPMDAVTRQDGLSSGESAEWAGGYLRESSSEDDRPGVNVAAYRIDPTGDDTSSYYGDEGTCGDGSGTYDDWNDWDAGGTADDDTAFICGVGGDNGTELSSMSTETISNVGNCVVVQVTREKVNVGSKTVDIYYRIEDASANSQEINTDIGFATAWSPIRVTFDVAPDGGTWTQGDIDALLMGVRTVDTNGANDMHTAMAGEIVTCDDDPPSDTVNDGDPQNFHRWTSP